MRSLRRSLDRVPGPLKRLLLAAALSAIAVILLPAAALAADYTVQRGDTLGDIADRFGTTAGAIARLNGIRNPNLIQIGQKLHLPGGSVAPTPTPAPSKQRSTVVRPGDTLIGIANRLDTTVAALVKANGIKNPDRIYVGQVLYAPGAGPSPTPTPATAGGYAVPVAGYRDYVPTHWNGHPGAADLMASKGTPIYSISSGTVVDVSNVGLGGNNVEIRGDDGRYYYYAHMRDYPMVREGQRVKSGQQIGLVGDTGNATGRPHLHLAIGDRITTGKGDGRGGYGTNFNVPRFLNRLIETAYRR